jgi:hypothetical protein
MHVVKRSSSPKSAPLLHGIQMPRRECHFASGGRCLAVRAGESQSAIHTDEEKPAEEARAYSVPASLDWLPLPSRLSLPHIVDRVHVPGLDARSNAANAPNFKPLKPLTGLAISLKPPRPPKDRRFSDWLGNSPIGSDISWRHVVYSN